MSSLQLIIYLARSPLLAPLSKVDAFDTFLVFVKCSERQLGIKPKHFHSDNGSEYINRRFTEYFEEHGVIHEMSIPYTSKLNGRAE